MNENDPTQNHGDGYAAQSGGGQSEAIKEVTADEVREDLKSIEEMRSTAEAPKVKGLRHTPSMYAAKKRKHKIALQKAARKRQRGK